MKGSSDWLHTETWPLVFSAKKVQRMRYGLVARQQVAKLPSFEWDLQFAIIDGHI